MSRATVCSGGFHVTQHDRIIGYKKGRQKLGKSHIKESLMCYVKELYFNFLKWGTLEIVVFFLNAMT